MLKFQNPLIMELVKRQNKLGHIICNYAIKELRALDILLIALGHGSDKEVAEANHALATLAKYRPVENYNINKALQC